MPKDRARGCKIKTLESLIVPEYRLEYLRIPLFAVNSGVAQAAVFVMISDFVEKLQIDWLAEISWKGMPKTVIAR